MPVSFEQFSQQVVASGLIPTAEWQAFLDALPANKKADGEQLARESVKQKKLTGFQAQQLYAGKGKALVLGNYVILDKLGQGGMGMVLKAEHRKMKRLVALKMLSPTVTKSAEATRRFQREVEAAAKLSHPNIVAAYDADESRGTHFLVMEYVAGTDLSALVKAKGPLEVDKAIACILQAARGLAFAHQCKVIHRDIKPSNLLLDGEGKVKVLDMGLARLESDTAEEEQLTGSGQIMGTIDFMAPEQAIDTRHADARADIYSLGMTLWFLLCGRPAYLADTVMKKLKAHEKDPIPSLRAFRPDVPPELDAVFTKMVAKTPAERFQTAAEIVPELERCLRLTAAGTSAADVNETELEERIAKRAAAGGTDVITPSKAASPSVLPFPTVTIQKQDTEPSTQTYLPAAQSAPATTRSQLNWKILLAGGGTIAALVLAVVIYSFSTQPVQDSVANPVVDPAEEVPPPEVAIASSYPWPTDTPAPAIALFNAVQAKKHREDWAAHLNVPPEKENSLKMKLVLIPPGEFMMGADNFEIEKAKRLATDNHLHPIRKRFIDTEAPRHKVILTKPFYIGTCEVTQGEWEKLMPRNPSRHAPGNKEKKKSADQETSRHPVDSVNWKEAQEFCAKLSAQESLPEGSGYRLPTEAEWEFACRAGTSSEFWSGVGIPDLERAMWYGRNSGDLTHAVGLKEPNAFGLHDTHGNVAEFVQDGYVPDYYLHFATKEAIDPQGGTNDSGHMARGGDATQFGYMCRSAKRYALGDDNEIKLVIGFRVVLPVK